ARSATSTRATGSARTATSASTSISRSTPRRCASSATTGCPAMNDAKRIRVLIVDDDRDDADLMNARLQRAGFAVRWAETEREFRNELNLSADVIVADYTMPAFGALQVLEIVAASGRDTPVIVVSGAVGEDKVGEVMTAGAADYLLK